MLPVPVTGLAANFSPMPRIAPPPLGKEMDGGVGPRCLAVGVLGAIVHNLYPGLLLHVSSVAV